MLSLFLYLFVTFFAIDRLYMYFYMQADNELSIEELRQKYARLGSETPGPSPDLSSDSDDSLEDSDVSSSDEEGLTGDEDEDSSCDYSADDDDVGLKSLMESPQSTGIFFSQTYLDYYCHIYYMV